MTRSENAAIWFDDSFNCSQSVLVSFREDFQLPEDLCLKIATVFGGGMARRQMTCGAVTGALMVLGLKFGRTAEDPHEKSKAAYNKAVQFMEHFIQRNGSINCRDLLCGLDMNDPEEAEKIRALGLFHTTCSKLVKDAVEICEEIIFPEGDPDVPGQ